VLATLLLGCPHRPPVAPRAKFDGELFGAPFVVVSALAEPSRDTPGQVTLTLQASPATCDDLAQARYGPERLPPATTVRIFLSLTDPPPPDDETDVLALGLSGRRISAFGPAGSGPLRGTIEVAQPIPTKPGDTGTVHLSYRAYDPNVTGIPATRVTDHLEGDVVFTLCPQR
jgi:hypothetical protein